MKFFYSLAFVMLLTSCASLRDSLSDSGKWKAAGNLVASKATEIAIRSVLNIATSSKDLGDKANWIDSLAAGVRFTSDDVTDLIGVFTPVKPHWERLAVELLGLTDREKYSEAQWREMVAVGLNAAAADVRLGRG